MGTNFYLRERPCQSCGRSDDIHVGKRSAGWSFGFRGYRHDPDDSVFSALGESVLSRADWRKFIARDGWRLLDEYGRQVDDPLAWLNELQAPDPQQRRWEDGHMGLYWRPSERDWRDEEGFRFYDGEFS